MRTIVLDGVEVLTGHQTGFAFACAEFNKRVKLVLGDDIDTTARAAVDAVKSSDEAVERGGMLFVK